MIAGDASTACASIGGYFVNGQAPGSDKFAYKMSWLGALRDCLRDELRDATRARAAGRLQHRARRPRRRSTRSAWARPDPLHAARSATTFATLSALGLHDASACSSSREKLYSWWDYRMLGFQKNRGLRIDHILVSDALKAAREGLAAIDRPPRKKSSQRSRTGDWPKSAPIA